MSLNMAGFTMLWWELLCQHNKEYVQGSEPQDY